MKEIKNDELVEINGGEYWTEMWRTIGEAFADECDCD